MEEKMLKTSWKQRLIISLVAAILLGSSIAVYAMIVLNGGSTDSTKKSSTTDVSKIEAEYEAKYAEYETRAKEISKNYFDDFKTYKSNVKAYNAEAANSSGVTNSDLKEGSGETITSTSTNYSAYYIGYCADESVFDSSFDDFDNPTYLKAPLEVKENSLIEGWYIGVNGMKVGGVREISIPGSLAYGESNEICGGYSTPLKFIIMAVEKDEQLSKLSSELEEIENRYFEAYYSSTSSEDSSEENDDDWFTVDEVEEGANADEPSNDE